jgi:hypothetical protein
VAKFSELKDQYGMRRRRRRRRRCVREGIFSMCRTDVLL